MQTKNLYRLKQSLDRNSKTIADILKYNLKKQTLSVLTVCLFLPLVVLETLTISTYPEIAIESYNSYHFYTASLFFNSLLGFIIIWPAIFLLLIEDKKRKRFNKLTEKNMKKKYYIPIVVCF